MNTATHLHRNADTPTRQVARLTLPILCLWAGRALHELTDDDFDRIVGELDHVQVRPTARERLRHRLHGLASACFQLRIIDRPRKIAQPPARAAAVRAGDIIQPELRRDVVRYAATLTATLKPATIDSRVKALMVLCDWLAQHHPDICRFDQLDRHRHIEPFLAWNRHRPWRGPRGNSGRTLSLVGYHHDVVDLRVFFDDIAEWGWPTQPRRRLLLVSDIPKLPKPLPRALPPDVDRTLMAAVADLDDPLVRTGLLLLRATGIRIGELLDLQLDCVIDVDQHGHWLKVPLGKLATERMVPLEPDTLAVLDTWTRQRSTQRALPHPVTGNPADFLFIEHGRRPTGHRFRQGLRDAVTAAGLTGPDHTPLRVTPHQLRHTFGTTLINNGMSLPGLMALLGHATPDMTLRYAQLANPTIRAAYQDAIAKTPLGRALPIAAINRRPTIPDRVTWLHQEMLKTRLAHGLCTRDPAAGPCPYANICEQCDNFQPAPEFADTIASQLDDIRLLRDDANRRGWHHEAARHDRVANELQRHLQQLTP